MKLSKLSKGKKALILFFAALLLIGATVVTVEAILNDYGGGYVQKIKFEDMDSTEVFVGYVNLSMMDQTPVIAVQSIDSSLYSAYANNWSFSDNFLFYNVWYDGAGTDSTGLIFLEVEVAPGSKWEIIDTLKSNDTSGFQGVVELRRKGPRYRVRTTVSDLTVSMYNGKMQVWFYKPGMDSGFIMDKSKYTTP